MAASPRSWAFWGDRAVIAKKGELVQGNIFLQNCFRITLCPQHLWEKVTRGHPLQLYVLPLKIKNTGKMVPDSLRPVFKLNLLLQYFRHRIILIKSNGSKLEKIGIVEGTTSFMGVRMMKESLFDHIFVSLQIS